MNQGNITVPVTVCTSSETKIVDFYSACDMFQTCRAAMLVHCSPSYIND